MPLIRSFDPASAPPEPSLPYRVRAGNPEGITRNAYESADGRKLAGQWESTVGAWDVTYTEWEYFLVTAGRARITGDDGTVIEAGPGDSVVIEPGFTGLFEVLEPMKKLYVIDLPA